MKTIITAAVLATIIASPAFAQSFYSEFGTGNLVAPPLAQSAPMGDSAHGAYASVGSRRRVYRSGKWHSRQVGYYRDMNGHLVLGETR